MSRKEKRVYEILKTALAHHKDGRLAEAETLCRKALKQAPQHPDALHLQGVIALQTGRSTLARDLIARAVQRSPDNADYLNHLGVAWNALGDAEQAADCYRRALSIRPRYEEAWFNLGNACLRCGRVDEALKASREVLQTNPSHVDARVQEGSALLLKGRPADAEACFLKALDTNPRHVGALRNLGTVLNFRLSFGQAAERLREAVGIDPQSAEAWHDLGISLKGLGEGEGTCDAFRRAIKVDPTFASAHFQLAMAHRFRDGDPELDDLVALVKRDGLPEKARAVGLFALSKAYDDLGDHKQAFSCVEQANLTFAGRFDGAAQAQRSRATRAMFPAPDRFRRDPDPEGPIPIFVLGLSRSGKTLVEGQLADSSSVFAAGERSEWFDAFHAVLDRHGVASTFPECTEVLDDPCLAEIGNLYMQGITRLGPGKRFYVNTLPTLHSHLGLIAGSLPSARIIYCRRDPMDTALSIYFTRYADGNEYAYTLGDIATYLRIYTEMMDHWRAVFGDAIFEVRYEDMVKDPRANAARLYRFCGIDGKPDSSTRLTTEGIGWWRNYRPFVDELVELLNPATPPTTQENGRRV